MKKEEESNPLNYHVYVQFMFQFFFSRHYSHVLFMLHAIQSLCDNENENDCILSHCKTRYSHFQNENFFLLFLLFYEFK